MNTVISVSNRIVKTVVFSKITSGSERATIYNRKAVFHLLPSANIHLRVDPNLEP